MEPKCRLPLSQSEFTAAEGSYLAEFNAAEARFASLENEINLLYEHVAFGRHSLAADDTYRSINAQELAWLGYTRNEVVGKLKFVDLLSPESRKNYAELVECSIQHGSMDGLELELVAKAGDIKHVLLSTIFRQDSKSENVASSSVLFDITGHKKAEQLIQKNEERFQLATEVGRTGTWDTDMVSGEMFWSRSHFELLGYKPYEVVPSQRAWVERVHPDDRSQIEAGLSGSMRDHVEYTAEFRVIWPDGSLRWLKASGRFRYGKDGTCLGISGAVNDITDFKLSMELLLESEQYYRMLFENTLDGFFYCKGLFTKGELQDFVFLNANKQFESFTGLAEVAGKKLSEVIPNILIENPEFLEVSNRVAATGTPERFERHLIHLNMWASIAIYSPRKEYFIVVFSDVTVQKRHEQELIVLNEYLTSEVSNRTSQLSDLAAHLQSVAEQERAHLAKELHDELGSTLAGMSMEVGHLKVHVTDQKILNGLSALKNLVTHAVEIKRNVVNELYPTILAHAGFTSALQWLVDEFRAHSGFDVESSISDNIKIEGTSALAAYRIAQECMTNIAKHAGADKVFIDAQVNAGILELTIKDNGKGLPSEKSKEGHGIFGMIERARYLGGSMEFVSEPKQGTTALLRIPQTISTANNKKRVLIVDDHAIVRDALRKLLECQTTDFSVAGEAEDGITAVQMAIHGIWDIVLLDISLPKMSGMKVLEAILAVKPDLPIIMLSSHSKATYADIAYSKGAVCYIEKGETLKLVEAMRHALA